MSASDKGKKDGNSKDVKRLLIEIPSQIHTDFKGLIYARGSTLKTAIIEYMEAVLEGERQRKLKSKK